MIVLFIFSLWDYSYNITADFIYDNNIFNYSEKDLNEFLEYQSPYRFPFETYDDLITAMGLNLLLRNNFFEKKTTTFNLGINLRRYWVNNEKSYQKIYFGIRQSFTGFAVKIWYRLIPDYLIRYYQNPKNEEREYIGCRLRYHTINGKITSRIGRSIKIDLLYKRGWDDYIQEFNQYDANYHTFSFNLGTKKAVEFECGYEFKLSRTDNINSLSGNTDHPDVSYDLHKIGCAIRCRKRLILPLNFKISYKFIFKKFSSDNPIDSLHFGRQDITQQASITAKTRIFPGMNLNIDYGYQWRRSSSTIPIDIESFKNYNKYKFKIGLFIYH